LYNVEVGKHGAKGNRSYSIIVRRGEEEGQREARIF
jgi:hypothetical protein